jgi:hypothetical protein
MAPKFRMRKCRRGINCSFMFVDTLEMGTQEWESFEFLLTT